MPRNYKTKTTRGDTPSDVIERAARKVADEKKSLRDVAVEQRIVDEINERNSKPKKATGTEKATKGRGESTKTGKDKEKQPRSKQVADWKCLDCSDWYSNSLPCEEWV
ncbi:Hypothetical predicted protein [Octopus vulgaris]|uniref:Uncharacterized protein n=1 Tax=Octopus vulgaris TaxID=6645 RepID=A0AA36AYL7_OCTVU|nr:Hypothetical predicted protein [Octopus vulgaris]